MSKRFGDQPSAYSLTKYDPDMYDDAQSHDLDTQDPNSDTPDHDIIDPQCPPYTSLVQEEFSQPSHHMDRKRSRSQSTTPSVHNHHHYNRQLSKSSSLGSDSDTLRHVSSTVSAGSVPVQIEYQIAQSKGTVPMATPFVFTGNDSRRCCAIVIMVVICFLLCCLTVIVVVIFIAFRPDPEY